MILAVPLIKKYAWAMTIWLAILFGMALFQNYLRYGHSEKYDIWNSIVYLCITILFFFPFGLLAIRQMWQLGSVQPSPFWKLISVAIGALIMHYIAGSLLIHLLGFYDSFFEVKFARQYFGREAFFHALALLALVYFISQERNLVKMVSGTMGRKELTLKAQAIQWIEADDHYLKIYAGETQLVKRATLEKMALDLSPDFIRIHRKYLVNRAHIVGREKQQRDKFVVLTSGERLKIGRSYSSLDI